MEKIFVLWRKKFGRIDSCTDCDGLGIGMPSAYNLEVVPYQSQFQCRSTRPTNTSTNKKLFQKKTKQKKTHLFHRPTKTNTKQKLFKITTYNFGSYCVYSKMVLIIIATTNISWYLIGYNVCWVFRMNLDKKVRWLFFFGNFLKAVRLCFRVTF